MVWILDSDDIINIHQADSDPPQIPVQNEMKLQNLGYFLPQHRQNRIKNNSQTRHLLKEWLDTMWVGHLWVVPEKKHELVSTTKDLNRLGNFLELSVFLSTDDQFTKGMLRFLNVQTSWCCIQKMYNLYSQLVSLVSSYGGWKIISLEGTTSRNSRFTSYVSITVTHYHDIPLPSPPRGDAKQSPSCKGVPWEKATNRWARMTQTNRLPNDADVHKDQKNIQMANHQVLIWYSRQYKHLASPGAIIWYVEWIWCALCLRIKIAGVCASF